ncbi:MAG: DUF3383 family protein [Elusimicrobiaceae bacterium]|nr:DUF3383 family protein [Elusimicrobiaceae bacterium]
MDTQGNISQSQYVAITSGVGGASAATEKELIARLVTDNQKAPSHTILEFEGNDAVGAYFGTTSEEYKFSSAYFGFISKSVRRPRKISFVRSTLEGLAPSIYPTKSAAPLATLKAITNGSLSLSIGGLTYDVTGLDFSSATNYSDVASALQTAIRANTEGGEQWTSATVSYNTFGNVFTLTGGAVGNAIILAATNASTGTDVSGLLGWNAASSPILSNGVNVQTVSELLAETLNLSNNFASLVFLLDLTTEQITEAAQYTHNANVQFKYIQRVTPDNYAEVQAAVSGFSGVCLAYDIYEDNSQIATLPAAIWAAADYNAVNGAPGAEFQKNAQIAPSVFTDALYTTLTAARVNFMGRTQQAGQPISFYQPGFLQGDILDEGVFMNEVWLKDKFVTACLNTQLALEKWPTGDDGLTIFDNITTPIRSLAKTNGVVAIGKTLTDTQKAYITQLTNDSQAWQQVQNQGDYMYRYISTQTSNGNTSYVLKYMYIYSKGDQIRKIEGSHILI